MKGKEIKRQFHRLHSLDYHRLSRMPLKTLRKKGRELGLSRYYLYHQYKSKLVNAIIDRAKDLAVQQALGQPTKAVASSAEATSNDYWQEDRVYFLKPMVVHEIAMSAGFREIRQRDTNDQETEDDREVQKMVRIFRRQIGQTLSMTEAQQLDRDLKDVISRLEVTGLQDAIWFGFKTLEQVVSSATVKQGGNGAVVTAQEESASQIEKFENKYTGQAWQKKKNKKKKDRKTVLAGSFRISETAAKKLANIA